MELQIQHNLRRLNDIPEEIPYKLASGQDFMPGYNRFGDKVGQSVGDRKVFEVVDSKSWRGGKPEQRAAERRWKYKNNGRDTRYCENVCEEEFLLGKKKPNSANDKVLAKEKKHFDRKATASMHHIGFEKSNQLAKELGMDWHELERFMSDPKLSELLAKADPKRTDQIIKQIKGLYNKYNSKIMSNTGHKFTFAYVTRYNQVGVDISNIYLVEEVVEKNEYLKFIFGYGKKKKPVFLSNSWQFSPKNPKQSLNMYMELLGCTPANPCYALFNENNTILHLYSNDQSKIIRVAPHEYTISEKSSGLHFHYYETGGDYSVNHRFMLDMQDPVNNLAERSPKYLQDLLLPKDEITNSANIIWKFR